MAVSLPIGFLLIQVVANSAFSVHSSAMRKTSDIIWQDKQHQVLFEILDLIAEPDSGSEVLQKLRFYTENHFSIEEEYMQLLDYPHRDAHIRAHNQFRHEMTQMMENHEAHDAVFMQIISKFLTEWLTRHVFGIDKQLEDFIMAAEVK